MKPLPLVAALALALAAAACGPKTPVARAALDCPMTQGELTRTSAASDGKACTYATAEGAEVTLQLVALKGGVDGALSSIEAQLLADREAAEPDAKPDEGSAEVGTKPSNPSATDAEKAVEQAENDAQAPLRMDDKGVDAADLDVKDGKTVVAESDDGTTRVSLPGIRIVANDSTDSANVKVGPISINAGDDGATIRIRRDVRLRGEALNPEKRGVRATFIYTGDDLPNGYRYVGYEAGGPKVGPITVAVVKSRSGRSDADGLASDVRKLVRKNGGV